MDFTQLTDTEIVSVLQHTKGSVCGRFRLSQLQRPLEGSTRKTLIEASARYKKMLAAVMLLAATPSLQSQTDSIKPTQEVATLTYDDQKGNLASTNTTAKREKNNLFAGRIIDADNKEPLEGAVVMIKNSQVGTLTDINGKFTLTVPPKWMQKDSVTFIVKYIGSEGSKITVSTTNIPKDKEIVMSEMEMNLTEPILMGIVFPVDPYKDPIYEKRRKR